jgi:Fe-S oxidoreductase
MKNFRMRDKNFFPAGDYKADIKNLVNCMLCPNMCRFDCGTLQAGKTETISPAYKSRIGYFLTTGKINPSNKQNKDFIDLMYKCSNEENCKVWCPFEFSVVSLLETVRDDLNKKGLMPDYCKEQIDHLKSSNTIEPSNIFTTYKEKGIENIETKGKEEVFYYIGCEMMKFPEVVKANIQILKKAGIKFSTNLENRICCAAPALNIRDLELVKEFGNKNKDLIKSTGAKVVISDCPGCVLTLTNRYSKLGIDIETKVIHISQYFKQLIDENKLKFEKQIPDKYKKISIHDPCLLARNLNDIESIRYILKQIPDLEIIEPLFNKEYTHCCGWSGTAHWADKDLAIKEATNRIDELKETGSNVFISACPLCELGLEYGINQHEKEQFKVVDLSEVIAKLL